MGLKDNTVFDYGTFTADNHASIQVNNINSFWGNGKTMNFAGTLDTSGLSGEGSIVLATFQRGALDGLNYNIDNLVIALDNSLGTVTKGWVTEGNLDKLTITYNIPAASEDNVPEPTTATLSLLALAGLAARRRRK